jgi:hypothetical protein
VTNKGGFFDIYMNQEKHFKKIKIQIAKEALEVGNKAAVAR